MKKIVIFLSLSVAGGSLLLVGCSKSGKSGPATTNSNSSETSSANGESGPIDLKLKWQVGKKYSMLMDLNRATDMNIHGQSIQQDLKVTQGVQYSPVKELDNGGSQVELEFNRQSIDFNQNGKDMLSYDSAQTTPVDTNGPAAAVAAATHAMLGVPLTFTFGPDGTVEKIEGLDTLSNNIAEAVPNQRLRMSLRELYNEDTLKRYGEFSESLPDHPVKVGDTWTANRDIDNVIGVLSLSGTYTFKDWEQRNGHNCAHIVITGDIKTKSASANVTGAIVNIKNGTITGDSWFDPDLGMFVDIKTDLETTADISTRQLALTQHMKQNVDMSLLGVDP